MNQNKDKKGSISSILILALIVISIVAGFMDTYFYGNFLTTKGISRWSLKPVNLKYIIEYLTSMVGFVLTAISLSPWLLILLIMYLPNFSNKKL